MNNDMLLYVGMGAYNFVVKFEWLIGQKKLFQNHSCGLVHCVEYIKIGKNNFFSFFLVRINFDEFLNIIVKSLPHCNRTPYENFSVLTGKPH